MARLNQVTRRLEKTDYLDIVSSSGGGSWVLSLPANLKMYQGELEALLGNVFSRRQIHPENLALAQQMSLNWCLSKCREVGISLEDSFENKTN